MKTFKLPQKLFPGDKVAIVSPSSGCAFLFPLVYELGLQRLHEEFNLVPVEFPTTRQTPDFLQKNPKARAEDINNAFADPEIKAIIATTGGLDEVRILPFLNREIIMKNPKKFFGYSDNSNIHLYLYKLGITSYYGCSVMSQLGMQSSMHEYTKNYLKKAFFEDTIGEVVDSPEWTDFDFDWSVPKNLTKQRPMEKSPGWMWQNFDDKVVSGKLFGGCLEILDLHLAVNSYLPSADDFDEVILYVETSEEMPTSRFVYRFFAALGERGLLQKLKALLVAIPKTQFMDRVAPEGREMFMRNQRDFINKALQDYGVSNLPVVFNLHFGHVDPQMVIPSGCQVIIDGVQQRISFE